MKIAILCLFSLLIVSCGRGEVGNLGVSESRGVGSTENLKWSENLIPIKIRFPKALESQIYQSAYYAIEEWNVKADRPLLYFEFVEMPVEMPSNNYDGVNNFYSQLHWESTSYEMVVLAVTRFSYYDGKLLEADIILNNTKSYHYRSQNDSIALNEYDVQSILVHEFGHFLGFNHNNESDSVMKPTLSSGKFARTLSTGDISRLRAKY